MFSIRGLLRLTISRQAYDCPASHRTHLQLLQQVAGCDRGPPVAGFEAVGHAGPPRVCRWRCRRLHLAGSLCTKMIKFRATVL